MSSNREQEILFELLRAAIEGRKPLLAGVTADQWRSVCSLVEGNTVVALTFESVALLDVSERPPHDIFMRWLALSEQKREHNRRTLAAIDDVQKALDAKGIRHVILKGIGVAADYPDYELRDGGDIDLFLPDGDESADEVLTAMADSVSIQPGERLGIFYKGIYVQVHYTPTVGRKRLKALKALFDSCTITVGGVAMVVPTAQYNALFLLSHLYLHFTYEGIGLRHITDLYYFFTKHDGEYDKALTAKNIKAVGMEPFAAFLMWVLVEKFHISESLLPIKPRSNAYSAPLLEETVTGGNFGHENDVQKVSRDEFDGLARKLFTIRTLFGRRRLFRRAGLRMPLRVFWTPIRKRVFDPLKKRPVR